MPLSAAGTRHARHRNPIEWLDAYTTTYYYCPSLALWRALEAEALGEEPITGPSLDVGAFDGSFSASWLDDRGPIDVGVDLDPRPSRFTTRAYRHLVAGDAQRLPFADRSFNFVLCNSVVEHIPDDIQAVREMARVLNPGGTLLMSTPSIHFHDALHTVKSARKRGDEAAARAHMAAIDRRAAHHRYRALEDWTSILHEAGLRLVAHLYCVPPSAAESWERWDRLGIRRILGRDLHGYLSSRKLARIVPPAFWKSIFKTALGRTYTAAVAEQERPGALGVDLVMRAVRE